MENEAHRVIIIQIGSMGRAVLKRELDIYGFKMDEVYTFFRMFDERVTRIVSCFNEPQLVLTSHVPGDIDAFEVARKIKSINISATVFAFTSTLQHDQTRQPLNGVIPKGDCRSTFISELVHAFLLKRSKEHLVKMVENCKSGIPALM